MWSKYNQISWLSILVEISSIIWKTQSFFSNPGFPSNNLPGNLPGGATPGRVSSSGALGLGGHYVVTKKPFRFCLNFASLFLNEFRLQTDALFSSSEF